MKNKGPGLVRMTVQHDAMPHYQDQQDPRAEFQRQGVRREAKALSGTCNWSIVYSFSLSPILSHNFLCGGAGFSLGNTQTD